MGWVGLGQTKWTHGQLCVDLFNAGALGKEDACIPAAITKVGLLSAARAIDVWLFAVFRS